MNTDGGRTYGGLTAADRRRQRREALIAAGLELFGTHGYPNVSVKRICAQAGLTQRYFYESFDDRPTLLAEVYNHCVDAARTATLTAAAAVVAGGEGEPIPDELIPRLAEVAIRGFVTSLTEDPRRARIITIEIVGVSPELEELRLRAVHGWADVIMSFLARGCEPTREQRLAAIGLVGATTQLLVGWQTVLQQPLGDGYDLDLFDVDAIHRIVTDMFIATHQRQFADPSRSAGE